MSGTVIPVDRKGSTKNATLASGVVFLIPKDLSHYQELLNILSHKILPCPTILGEHHYVTTLYIAIEVSVLSFRPFTKATAFTNKLQFERMDELLKSLYNLIGTPRPP